VYEKIPEQSAPGPAHGRVTYLNPGFFGTAVLGQFSFSNNYQIFILKQNSEFISYFQHIGSNFFQNVIWILQGA
jgi:hypothetical protein